MNKAASIILILVVFITVLPEGVSAAENDIINIDFYSADQSLSKSGSSGKMHKILGWSSIGLMAISIGTGFFIPEDGHCLLSGIATGAAVMTCINGYIEYGSLISFKNGDWRINYHAILGTAATAGFITTLALGKNDNHVIPGIISAATFSIATIVLYF